MGMPLPESDRRWTVDDVRALPDDGCRYEIIDGELLVTPAPEARHQRLQREFLRHLLPYLEQENIAEVLCAPFDVEVSIHTMVQPDIVVLPLRDGQYIDVTTEPARPILAVEIISPSSARMDRVKKQRLYAEIGIPEYWCVDPEARVIHRWITGDPRPEQIDCSLRWTPPGSTHALELDVEAVFRNAEKPPSAR